MTTLEPFWDARTSGSPQPHVTLQNGHLGGSIIQKPSGTGLLLVSFWLLVVDCWFLLVVSCWSEGLDELSRNQKQEARSRSASSARRPNGLQPVDLRWLEDVVRVFDASTTCCTQRPALIARMGRMDPRSWNVERSCVLRRRVREWQEEQQAQANSSRSSSTSTSSRMPNRGGLGLNRYVSDGPNLFYTSMRTPYFLSQ